MTKGMRIKLHRERLGYSQTDFAKMVGITKQSLYKYENSIITNIPSDKLEAIAQKLGVNPGVLMGWEEVDTLKCWETQAEYKEEDALSDIFERLSTDTLFLDVVKKLNVLNDNQLDAINNMILMFKQE